MNFFENIEYKSEKEEELEEIITKMKRNIMTCETANEKIKLLNNLPDKWSVDTIVNTFNVSKYIAQQSKLNINDLNTPIINNDKRISDELKLSIKEFFENDEISRMCPGKKDCRKIDGIVHHKRMLLHNVSNVYNLFINDYKDKMNIDNEDFIKPIGLSKFHMLRPKWCISVASNGLHNVCVCAIHQNVKLMVNSLPIKIDYRELIDEIVCDRKSNTCMLRKRVSKG